MNMINSIRVGEKIPYSTVKSLTGNIDYTLFLFPVLNNQLLYGDHKLVDEELELVKLEDPPATYSQYEYSGYANHLFSFTDVDDPSKTIKYRSIELSEVLQHINTSKITMKRSYVWNIRDGMIVQSWGCPIPTSFRVQKLNTNSLMSKTS